MTATIRSLRAADAEEYLALLKRGIAEHPALFRSGPEDVANTWAAFVTPSGNDFTLAAFADEGRMVGVVSFAQETKAKRRHTGLVYLMYVARDFEGQGIGGRLLRDLIERVRKIPELTHVALTITTVNERAKRLYASVGFEAYAMEKRALKINGMFYDEEHMALRLDDDQ